MFFSLVPCAQGLSIFLCCSLCPGVLTLLQFPHRFPERGGFIQGRFGSGLSQVKS